MRWNLYGLIIVSLAAVWYPIAAPASSREYEPGKQYPFGRPNPMAPQEISQFHFMIGNNNCVEERRDSSNGAWIEGQRSWDAHYTMNGFAIIDTGRSGQSSNGNMRLFDLETKQWVVTFFAMPVFSSGVWRGQLTGTDIVLKQPQKAPGLGLDGISRLTFHNITDTGFDWIGEWLSDDGTVVYPFWKISCKKSTR